MKHIFLNLKRFDVPVEYGGVNRLAPPSDWGRASGLGRVDFTGPPWRKVKVKASMSATATTRTRGMTLAPRAAAREPQTWNQARWISITLSRCGM